ncbi:Crp/Fnr family transcriptional regulator [Paenibacillus antri]|uniref:Crp/Fnr family transcriptional regulator n=1 Tax=Paenibacillus antri TaxID=2582848 RepID=A0A5R9GFZ2_9BACL|nr:Crp/Fnr family transcriptional regulator [Paenibacillus antri]TLS51623.1 Crp/Fnr family transcriptional regulator [Paenibacillus antri]
MKEILKTYLTRYTSLDEAAQQAILDDLRVEEYKKGTILLKQGDVPDRCYFVLKGCVRQYTVDEDGRELTSEFYTEEQAIAMFHRHRGDPASEYTYACLEDTAAVVGALDIEQDMYDKHAQLEGMTRRMIEQSFGHMQEEFAAFVASSPEERYMSLLRKRPNLIDRVPQHQLASYLGVTPESLSRIKRRVHP